ncbi:helix-turn-helix domain-containing protein [Caballeronia sp. LjRoot34]|uniref:helix-turn-helix domain-containing protein n=1 Tax=Caballeronia sp. LjRoot34 TaxID=3342325 RepID=UPI003ECEC77B
MAELAKLFAEEMRVRRDKLSLTQEAFGAPLGLDRSAVSRIEKSAPNLSISKAVLIASALKTSVSEMVGGEKSDKTAQQITEGMATRIRKWRAENGLNQRELAEKVDVDRNRVSAVESGKKNVTLETIERFANALDISPLEFL